MHLQVISRGIFFIAIAELSEDYFKNHDQIDR